METGVLTNKVRQEIVRMLRNLMSLHTRRPTSIQYTYVCMQLVAKYPHLKDGVGTGYVSM